MALTTRQSSDTSTSQFSEPKKRRKLLLIIITSSFLLGAIIATASALFARHATTSSLEPTVSHTILRSSCHSARYPDLCYSAVAASPKLVQTISQPKDVIHASLNLTITAIRSSFRHVEWLSATRFHLTTQERTALLDCLEIFEESLDELRLTEADLRAYPTGKPLHRHALDLEILVSATMTNQESCMDGFAHDEVDRCLRNESLSGLLHVTRMCRNALAMIKNMIDTDIPEAEAVADGGARGRGRRMLGFKSLTVSLFSPPCPCSLFLAPLLSVSLFSPTPLPLLPVPPPPSLRLKMGRRSWGRRKERETSSLLSSIFNGLTQLAHNKYLFV